MEVICFAFVVLFFLIKNETISIMTLNFLIA